MLCQSDKKNETSEVLFINVTNKDLSTSNTGSRPGLKNIKDTLNETCDTFTTDDVNITDIFKIFVMFLLTC